MKRINDVLMAALKSTEFSTRSSPVISFESCLSAQEGVAFGAERTTSFLATTGGGRFLSEEAGSIMRKEGVVIGLDFDNTIICYDLLIHALAIERGLISPPFPPQKKIIRKQIIQAYGDEEWQKIQAIVYGERIGEATAAPGVEQFLEQCRKQQIPVYIISHKTEYSNLLQGGTNFRTAALKWMEQQQFFSRFGLQPSKIHFTSTREEKVQKIKELGCTHFIDDLEEVFQEKNFPAGVIKILYAPEGKAVPGVIPMKQWGKIYDYFFH